MNSKAGDAFRKAARELAAAHQEGSKDLAELGLEVAKREAPYLTGEIHDDLRIEVEEGGQKRSIVSDTGHSMKAEFILKPFIRPAGIEMENSHVEVVGGKILAKLDELDIE